MGFDPRRWRPTPGGRTVTANLDALLAENEALRRELRQLREEFERLRRQGSQGKSRQQPGPAGPHPQPRSRVSQGAAPSVTAARVERWVEAMARHRHWSELRVGPPGGLRALIDQLRAQAWNPSLSLEEELDRRQSGLGRELSNALRGPHSRGRWAVRAAFALYGPSAIEWLSDEPLRVVSELLRRLPRQAPPPPDREPEGAQGRRRGTRTANHSEAGGDQGGDGGDRVQGRSDASRGSSSGSSGPTPSSSSGSTSPSEGQTGSPGPSSSSSTSSSSSSSSSWSSWSSSSSFSSRPRAPDPRRDALVLLDLEPGASPAQIKRRYRQLAKTHHPDLGGDPEAFRQLEAAYRMLVMR